MKNKFKRSKQVFYLELVTKMLFCNAKVRKRSIDAALLVFAL